MKGAPLMLVLFARGAGSGAAETRWRVDPAPGWVQDGIEFASGGGPARWRLERVKDKAGRPAAWEASLAAPSPGEATPAAVAA